MMDTKKPFLEYKDQIRHLESKGIICNLNEDKELLIKHGYFNLVNGYKRAFLETERKPHKYIKNASIRDFAALKEFDSFLRGVLFETIASIEDEIRTITSHIFDSITGLNDLPTWKQESSYDDRGKRSDIKNLINSIKGQIDDFHSYGNAYITHYNHELGYVPTWAMIKIIKFTTFIELVRLSKKELRVKLCCLYNIEFDEKINKFTVFIGAMQWMRKVRNACAHNERVYEIRCNTNRVVSNYHRTLTTSYSNNRINKSIMDLIIYLKYFLSTSDYQKVTGKINDKLRVLRGELGEQVFTKVRSMLGVKSVDNFYTLHKNVKEINYLILGEL